MRSMMVANEGQHMAERFERRADLLSNDGVFLYNFGLGRIKRPGLESIASGTPIFADIVEAAQRFQRVKIVLGQTKALSESHALLATRTQMRLSNGSRTSMLFAREKSTDSACSSM